MSLIVTGSIGIDTIHAPTGSAESVLGGSCTYFSAAAALYGPVRLVAAVGDDFPDEHERTLQHFPSIDISGLEKRAGSNTFRWTGKYHENMNIRETTDVTLGVLGEDPPGVPESFHDSRYVFLANTDPLSQLRFLDSFPDPTLVVADTMDLWIKTESDRLNELIHRIDALVLNDSEAEMMTSAGNTITAARQIRRQYDLDFVIVKKGEHGSILMHPDGIALLPAYPAEKVIDPTGAGDSFAGALMGVITRTGRADFPTLQQALAHGTIMSSFTIESFSLDRLTNLTMDEINQRLDEFANYVQIRTNPIA